MKYEVHSVRDKISANFEKVEQDRHISSYDISEELDVVHKTVLRHLRKSWWVQVKTCHLLQCDNFKPFLKQLITDDEK